MILPEDKYNCDSSGDVAEVPLQTCSCFLRKVRRMEILPSSVVYQYNPDFDVIEKTINDLVCIKSANFMAMWLNYCFPAGTQRGLLMNRPGGGGDGLVAVIQKQR